MKFKVLVSIIALSILGQGNSYGQQGLERHRIVEIKKLIEDISGIQWMNGSGEQLSFGQSKIGYPNVYRSRRADHFEHNGKQSSEIPESEKIDTVAIDMLEGGMGYPSFVKGVYPITLPADLKHIQIELEYDLFRDFQNSSVLNEFYVEIEELDEKNVSQWKKNAEIREPESVRRKDAVFYFNTGEGDFTNHCYVADLSKWAGKTVRIVLVSKNNSNRIAKGRWVQARLVGSTFDIQTVLLNTN